MSAFEQLTTMSRQDLVGRFDHAMQSTAVGASWWRDEIFRRDFDQQNRTLIEMTRNIRFMTAVVTALTVANVVLVLYTII